MGTLVAPLVSDGTAAESISFVDGAADTVGAQQLQVDSLGVTGGPPLPWCQRKNDCFKQYCNWPYGTYIYLSAWRARVR